MDCFKEKRLKSLTIDNFWHSSTCIESNWNLTILVVFEGRKPENSEKIFLRKDNQVHNLSPGHFDCRQALSPLCLVYSVIMSNRIAFFLLQAKVDLWKQQCLDLDVVLKEGHLMLQQESSGQAVAFEEKLGDLNTEWHTVIQVWLGKLNYVRLILMALADTHRGLLLIRVSDWLSRYCVYTDWTIFFMSYVVMDIPK